MSGVWLRSPAGRRHLLRVLAYHAVEDAEGFDRQLLHLVRQYRPVSAADVVAALDGETLPPRAVWLTFDDGDPTVVDVGLPLLQKQGVPATMFICPGVVDTSEPYWWQIIESAQGAGLSYSGVPVGEGMLAALKCTPDDERRTVIADLRSRLEAIAGPIATPQLSSSGLGRWLAAGMTIGNHTWDHPVLDQCLPAEQDRQIRAAHEWLVQRGGSPVLFAYPNGNPSPHAKQTLAELGYRVGLLFDHRLTGMVDPLKMSRVRSRADGDLARFKAMASGLHPAWFELRR